MPTTASRRRSRRRILWAVAGVAALLGGLLAAWRWSPLHDLAEPGLVAQWLHGLAKSPWAPVVIGGVHAMASLLMFPNTVLCLAIILALGPTLGTAYAFGGSLLAALAGYLAGRFGGRPIEKLRVRSVDRLGAELRRGGFRQVLMLRFLPVAPFTVVNLLSGAARVRVLPFLAATVVGIAPYILAFAFFGRQARRLLSDPTPAEAAITAGVLVAAAVAVWQTRSLAAARSR